MVNLYFQLDGESETDRGIIASRVSAIVSAIKLDTEADLQTAVTEWLNQIVGPNLQKRRVTAQAVAASAISPEQNRYTIFDRPDVISRTTFYNTKKPWLHDPEYRFILEVLVAIYRKWESGTAVREMLERQAEWRDLEIKRGRRLHDMSEKMITKLEEMLSTFLLEEIEVQDDDGRTVIIKPANADLNTVPRFATAIAGATAQASKTVRMALGMDTEQTAVSVKAEVAETSSEDIRAGLLAKMETIGLRLARPAASTAEEPTEETDGNETEG